MSDTPNTTDIDQSEYVSQPVEESTGQFTANQRRVIYLATFLTGVVTVVAAPVITAIQTPAWIPALIGGLGSAAATISSAFGWRYLGK